MRINVSDLNDNVPTFSSPSYEARVLEEQPVGTVVDFVSVLCVHARDCSASKTLQCFANVESFFFP